MNADGSSFSFPHPSRANSSFGLNPALAYAGNVAHQAASLPILEKARKRLLFVGFGFILFYALIIGRLFDVMILNPDQVRQSAPPPILSERADITDRNGELLATSLRVASLSADPALILDEKDTLKKLKSVFPDLNLAALSKEFHSGKRFVWIKRNLSPRQQDAANRLGLPGLNFETEAQRFYPKGALTAHVIGYNGVDHHGLAGIENKFDGTLKNGDAPLALSLDVRLQGIMRDALMESIAKFKAIGGAGIMMDIHTGEILSLVSLPDFDPHEAGKATDDQIFNRASLGTYEMGSTFKTFAIAEALDQGKIQLGDRFDTVNPIKIGRFAIKDYHPTKRWYNVPEIYLQSSNIGAVHIIERVGAMAQKAFLKKIGLLDPSPIEVPEVGRPLVPQEWRDVNMMTISFGHGLAVNAVQLASATAAMINGGYLVKPTLIKQAAPPPRGPAVISRQTSDQIRALMRIVVTDGTGKSAGVPGYVVGGKTGTAEKKLGKGYNKNARLSSFIAAFPIHDPKYLIYVMIDEPKGTKETYGFATGGWTAAPVVAKVVAQAAPMLHITPVDENDISVQEKLRLPVSFSTEK